MTDTGQMLQWEFFAAGRALQGRLVRSVPLGKGVEYCVVDDAAATLYYGDEALGVLSVPVEPETDAARSLFDFDCAARRHRGRGQGPRARARARTATACCIVSDVSAERLSVYGLDGTLKGRLQIGAGSGIDAVGESEGLALATAPRGDRLSRGPARDRRPGQRRAPTATSSWSAGARRALRSASPPARPARIRAPRPPAPRTRSCRRSKRLPSKPGAMRPTIRRSGSIRRIRRRASSSPPTRISGSTFTISTAACCRRLPTGA